MPVYDKSPLPLSLQLLPEKLQPIMDPAKADPRRRIIAGAELPMPLETLVPCLAFLFNDPDNEIRSLAREAIKNLGGEKVLQGLGQEPDPAILDVLVRNERDPQVLATLLTVKSIDDRTLLFVASESKNDSILDLIGLNQGRMAKLPTLVEALYFNPSTSMGTAQRVVEFAIREKLTITQIPGFKEMSQAFGKREEGPEEPVVVDKSLIAALLEPDHLPGQAEALTMEEDEEAPDELFDLTSDSIGEGKAAEKDGPLSESLYAKVRSMNVPDKIRLAIVGNLSARTMMIQDKSKLVSSSVLENPGLSIKEVASFARNKNIGEEIIRKIAFKKEWTRSYFVRLSLLYNPKTPFQAANRFIKLLRRADLKLVAKSREVSRLVAKAAQEELAKQETKK